MSAIEPVTGTGDVYADAAAALRAGEGVAGTLALVGRQAAALGRADDAAVSLGSEGQPTVDAWATSAAARAALDAPPAGPPAGFRGLLRLPLVARGATIGALVVLAAAREFAPGDAAALRIFSAHAAVALHAAREEEGLRRALEGRLVIGQAQGILMERHGIDEHRAFAVLKRHSQDANVRLREIAEQVVATRRLPLQP